MMSKMKLMSKNSKFFICIKSYTICNIVAESMNMTFIRPCNKQLNTGILVQFQHYQVFLSRQILLPIHFLKMHLILINLNLIKKSTMKVKIKLLVKGMDY